MSFFIYSYHMLITMSEEKIIIKEVIKKEAEDGRWISANATDD